MSEAIEEIHKRINNLTVETLDRMVIQRFIKMKQFHLYEKHPRKRQLDKLIRMKNGRHFNKGIRRELKEMFEYE